MKVLFSEGSSTSARQSLHALGPLGHVIDICDSQRLGICRLSRYVRRWRLAPAFGRQPREYLRFVLHCLEGGHYDVLFPAHDQVYLFSRYRDALRRRIGLAVPDFEVLGQVQSKTEFTRLLKHLDIPQPETEVVPNLEALDADWRFPCWVKRALGTAGRGTWHVRDRRELQDLVERLRATDGEVASQGYVVQQPAHGEFRVAQMVFQRGALVGWHTFRSRGTGAGGAPFARESVADTQAIGYLAKLGSHLGWHGALHSEYFYDQESGAIAFMEANPRIGETFNATLSGVNLCEYLLRVSLDEAVEPAPPPRPGVLTHAIMTSILGLGEQGQNRRTIRREIKRWRRGEGLYLHSEDELTRWRDDWPSLLPAAAVAAQLLIWPGWAPRIIQKAVDHYALGATTARQIELMPKDELMPQEN